MKKLILIISLLVILGACRKHQNELYYNIDMKIVKINNDCSLTDDKFHVPQTCNTVLLETIKEPKLYVELNDCREKRFVSSRFEIIKTKWWYNHQVGDTVHFDYIRKIRFFEINR